METLNSILVREEEARKLNTIINGIVDWDSNLQSGNVDKEHEIIDLVIGKEPIYKHLESLKHKPKTNGGLLLSETDWQEFINRLLSESEISTNTEDFLRYTPNIIQEPTYSNEKILLQRILDVQNRILALLWEIFKILARKIDNKNNV